MHFASGQKMASDVNVVFPPDGKWVMICPLQVHFPPGDKWHQHQSILPLNSKWLEILIQFCLLGGNGFDIHAISHQEARWHQYHKPFSVRTQEAKCFDIHVILRLH